MKITFEQFTEAGREFNEDSHYICENFGFVFDGATGMADVTASDMVTDAAWFTYQWKEFLKEALKKPFPLKEILKQGITKIDKMFMKFPKAPEVTIKPIAPLSLFRIIGNEIEFFGVGDTNIIITYVNGDIKEYVQDDVAKLDQENMKVAMQIAKKEEKDFLDIVPLMRPFLQHARLKCNKPNGYWSIGDTFETLDNAIYFKKSIKEIKQIILTSDGYSQLFDKFPLYSLESFAKTIEAGTSLPKLYEELYEAQEKDPKANEYPRFKLRDDATAIVLKINH